MYHTNVCRKNITSQNQAELSLHPADHSPLQGMLSSMGSSRKFTRTCNCENRCCGRALLSLKSIVGNHLGCFERAEALGTGVTLKPRPRPVLVPFRELGKCIGAPCWPPVTTMASFAATKPAQASLAGCQQKLAPVHRAARTVRCNASLGPIAVDAEKLNQAVNRSIRVSRCGMHTKAQSSAIDGLSSQPPHGTATGLT